MTTGTPQWRIVRVLSGHEETAQTILEARGAIEAWYPHEWQIHQRRLSAKECMGLTRAQIRKAKRKRVKVASITGYVLALFEEEPDWRRMRDRHRQIIDCVRVGENPYTVPLSQMEAMRQVPDTIRQIVETAEARNAALREARRPKVGEPAAVIGGALAGIGKPVMVTAIKGEEAAIDAGGLMSVWCAVDHLERVPATT